LTRQKGELKILPKAGVADVFIVSCSERHKPRASIRNQHLKLKIRVAGEGVVAGRDTSPLLKKFK